MRYPIRISGLRECRRINCSDTGEARESALARGVSTHPEQRAVADRDDLSDSSRICPERSADVTNWLGSDLSRVARGDKNQRSRISSHRGQSRRSGQNRVRGSGRTNEAAAILHFGIARVFRKTPSRAGTDCESGAAAGALREFVRARRSIRRENSDRRPSNWFAGRIGGRSDCPHVRGSARTSQRSEHVARRHRGHGVACVTKTIRPRGVVDLSADQMHARHARADCGSDLGPI